MTERGLEVITNAINDVRTAYITLRDHGHLNPTEVKAYGRPDDPARLQLSMVQLSIMKSPSETLDDIARQNGFKDWPDMGEKFIYEYRLQGLVDELRMLLPKLQSIGFRYHHLLEDYPELATIHKSTE